MNSCHVTVVIVEKNHQIQQCHDSHVMPGSTVPNGNSWKCNAPVLWNLLASPNIVFTSSSLATPFTKKLMEI